MRSLLKMYALDASIAFSKPLLHTSSCTPLLTNCAGANQTNDLPSTICRRTYAVDTENRLTKLACRIWRLSSVGSLNSIRPSLELTAPTSRRAKQTYASAAARNDSLVLPPDCQAAAQLKAAGVPDKHSEVVRSIVNL